MNDRIVGLTSLVFLAFLITACAGTRTFHEYARAGDTVALAAGWKHNFDKNNITVTFIPELGFPVVYPLGDPAIRASINMYPDPLSGLVVSYATGINQTQNALSNAHFLNNSTEADPDWWQTVVFLDVPATLSTGNVTINIQNPEGETASSTLNIIPGLGQPNTFSSELAVLGSDQFSALARIPHYTVEFSDSGVVPYALEVSLSHDPDISLSGVGKAFVSNPRSESKNVLWTDDGISTRVLLIRYRPTPNEIPNIKHFKFYLAGGVTNVAVSNITAYDLNGVVVTGVTATVSPTQ